mmetsp:Transcript_113089/g.241380  ORF Transcript_113089/g.241380 Transcript_113089/m.241380 type:complete len:354 (+) Transcript_113089:62-1123(+)
MQRDRLCIPDSEGLARLLTSPPRICSCILNDVASACALAVDVKLESHLDVLVGLECPVNVGLAEVQDCTLLDRLAPRLRTLLHLHNLLLDRWRQGNRSVHGDEAPTLLPVVVGDDALVDLPLEHLPALQVLREEGHSAGHGHVVSQEMTGLILDDAELHRRVLHHSLGPLAPAVHLGQLHPQLLGHRLIELVAIVHGDVAKTPRGIVELQHARIAQLLRTDEGLLLRVDGILVRNHLATRIRHRLRSQCGAAPGLPLHHTELNLLVLHQERVTVLSLDVAPVDVQLVLGDNALLVDGDEAVPMPFVVVHDSARELGVCGDFKVLGNGWRRPGTIPTALAASPSHRWLSLIYAE